MFSFETGAFDRFVYIHGHTSSTPSSTSKWCRRASSKSGSIILLVIPILCSLPLAICNLLHAHVLLTTARMKNCIVQYNHGILISFVIFFYILPLLFSFFLHAKLIYFIRSKHYQHYLTTASHSLPIKRNITLDSQMTINKKRNLQNQNILINNQQLLQPKKTKTKSANRRTVMFSSDTNGNTAGTIVTTTTAAGHQAGTTNSSNSSASSHSSTGTGFASLTSPIILYKINSQAIANAKRTVLLLVLLLSFYVLCWAPYNIYTWRHAYLLTTSNSNETLSNRTLESGLNQTITSSTDTLHADLRRIIFINYSLYLLSMISMCFSFIFYFALNKQARREFSNTMGCICPWLINMHKEKQRKQSQRRIHYHTRYQHHYSQNNQNLVCGQNNNQRMKTTKFNTHPMIVPPTPLLIDRKIHSKYINSSQAKFDKALSKRTVLTYGCHVQCCP